MRTNFIFMDGAIIPSHKALADFLAPGTLKGTGAFETMRAKDDGVYDFDRHMNRLTAGLKMLSIKNPCQRRELKKIVFQVLRINQFHDARVRLTVWQNKAKTHCAVVTMPYRPYTSQRYQRGYKAVISNVRINSKLRSPQIKSIDYQPFQKAYQQARHQGYDEAILLNENNEITEGSRTNIFFVKDGVLITPALSCGCLNGIMRQTIIRLARQCGVKCSQKRMGQDIIDIAQESFVTNSLLRMMPLTSIGKRKMGGGKIGPVTQRLVNRLDQSVKKQYLKEVRNDLYSSCS